MASQKFEAGSSAPLAPDKKYAVWGQSDIGYGVVGTSQASSGIQGGSIDGIGAVGTSQGGTGVVGTSQAETGVYGSSAKDGRDGNFPGGSDRGEEGGVGVLGDGRGVRGTGVLGSGIESGVRGTGLRAGVVGSCDEKIGVLGAGRVGVFGWAVMQDAPVFLLPLRCGPPYAGLVVGVVGTGSDFGVIGDGHTGVRGQSDDGYGVSGIGGDIGVFAGNGALSAYLATNMLAADFYGNSEMHGDLHVVGRLRKDQGGFLVDHPSDPANRYLEHSFVESNEMKNIYDGVAVLDSRGEAGVELPDWFELVMRGSGTN